MAWEDKPEPLGQLVGYTDTTPQATGQGNHLTRHREVNAAIDAILAILGDDPTAGDATVSAAVKAGRHHYVNFVVRTGTAPPPSEETPEPENPFTTFVEQMTTTEGLFPINPDSGWHMYVFSGKASSDEFVMLKLVPGPNDGGPNEDPNDLTGRTTIMVEADFQPTKDDLYNSRIHLDVSLGGAAFGQHRLWYVGNDIGPSSPHSIVLQGVTHTYVDSVSAAPVSSSNDYQGMYYGDTGFIGDTTEDFDITCYAAELLDDSEGRMHFVRKNMNHRVRLLTTVNGVESPEVPVGASSIVAVKVGDTWEWRWENVAPQARVFPVSVILATPTLTPSLPAGEEPGTPFQWVWYQRGASPDAAGHNDFWTFNEYNWSGTFAQENAPTYVLILEAEESWPTKVARVTSAGFEPIEIMGGDIISLSCGGAAYDTPTLWVGRNNGAGDNLGNATAPHLPATWFTPVGMPADQVWSSITTPGPLNGLHTVTEKFDIVNNILADLPEGGDVYRSSVHADTIPVGARVVFLDASSQNPWQHFLPAGADVPDGKVFRVHRSDTSGNACTLEVQPTSSDTFHLTSGGTALTLQNYFAVDVRWDATLGVWWANNLWDAFD